MVDAAHYFNLKFDRIKLALIGVGFDDFGSHCLVYIAANHQIYLSGAALPDLLHLLVFLRPFYHLNSNDNIINEKFSIKYQTIIWEKIKDIFLCKQTKEKEKQSPSPDGPLRHLYLNQPHSTLHHHFGPLCHHTPLPFHLQSSRTSDGQPSLFTLFFIDKIIFL